MLWASDRKEKYHEIVRLWAEEGYILTKRGTVFRMQKPYSPKRTVSLKLQLMDGGSFDDCHKVQFKDYKQKVPHVVDYGSKDVFRDGFYDELYRIVSKATDMGWVIPHPTTAELTLWGFAWPHERIVPRYTVCHHYIYVGTEIHDFYPSERIKKDHSLKYFPEIEGMQMRLL